MTDLLFSNLFRGRKDAETIPFPLVSKAGHKRKGDLDSRGAPVDKLFLRAYLFGEHKFTEDIFTKGEARHVHRQAEGIEGPRGLSQP